MTFSKFEKYAAGKINNHASEVDTEGLWNDILPHVQKDDRNRKGLVWIFLIGLIASMAAIYAFLDKNSDPGNNYNTFSTANVIQNDEDLRISGLAEKESFPISEQKPATLEASNNQNIIAKSTQKNQFSKTKKEKYKASDGEILIAAKSSTNKYSPESKSNDAKVVVEKTENHEAIDFEENAVLKANILKNEEAIPTDAEHAKIEVDESNLPIAVESTENPEVKEEMNSNTDEENSEEDFRRNSNFKLKYGIGIFGGLSSSFASLKNNDELNVNYLQTRVMTEEQLETIQMGIDFMVKSEIGVYLRTGVQYSRIARKFSLNDAIETIDSIHGIQRIYINNNTNDTIYVYGPVPVTTTTFYNKTTYNYFHLMDIPVVLGYMYNHENWSFGAEAGALINISTKRKGDILDLNNEFYDLKDDQLKWYKDNIGVSFTASVTAAYHLNDNFQIYLAPTARLENVFSTDDNPVAQKHGSLGVNIGARYFIGY